MNVNKKLGRFKQWAGERMGGEVKTSVSDDFKSLEVEMGLRQEGSTEHCLLCERKLGLITLRHGAPSTINDGLRQNFIQAPRRG